MRNRVRPRLRFRCGRVLLVVLLLLAVAASPAGAAGEEPRRSGATTGRAIYDALLLRPLGFIQVVVSAAVFPIFYPVALPFGAGDEVIEICITQPVDRTFRRPLGDL